MSVGEESEELDAVESLGDVDEVAVGGDAGGELDGLLAVDEARAGEVADVDDPESALPCGDEGEASGDGELAGGGDAVELSDEARLGGVGDIVDGESSVSCGEEMVAVQGEERHGRKGAFKAGQGGLLEAHGGQR